MFNFLKLLLKEVKSKEVTEVIIKPKYLVPDTNCFIDHLNDLIRLIDSGHFVVAVPLVGESRTQDYYTCTFSKFIYMYLQCIYLV